MRLRCARGLFILTINDKWHHRRDSFSEGVAFVHIELYLRKAHTQKPLVMLGKFCFK